MASTTPTLAVRDLASGMQLALAAGARSDGTGCDGDVGIVVPAKHGPPLVLKSDNGSAFKSDSLSGNARPLRR